MNVYARKSAFLKIALPPLFDVKYLMNVSLEWAPLFSLYMGAHLKNSI